jgi:hypothetical protein
MSISIVVARYSENVEWTKQFQNVIIYNKGTPLSNSFNEICLDNVGREGHTYYKHIYDNYDNLDDHIIFLQGNPFDHSPNVIQSITTYMSHRENVEFNFLSERLIECNLTGCKYHTNLPLINIYEKIFGEKKEPFDFIFGSGAQFMVSKNKILKRSREFYLNIIKLLENDISPIEGYVIERFHKLIFESD